MGFRIAYINNNKKNNKTRNNLKNYATVSAPACTNANSNCASFIDCALFE